MSVARDIFAKSFIEDQQQHRKSGDNDLAGPTNATATKAAFRIVRLILLIIQVRMRWWIVRPCSTRATMFVSPASVRTIKLQGCPSSSSNLPMRERMSDVQLMARSFNRSKCFNSLALGS